MAPPVNLRVTEHAIQRWRERVAPDEGRADIVLAFARAKVVPKREQLPFPRVPGTAYRRHADLPHVYFPTTQQDRGPVLLTVIDARLLWGVPRDRPG